MCRIVARSFNPECERALSAPKGLTAASERSRAADIRSRRYSRHRSPPINTLRVYRRADKRRVLTRDKPQKPVFVSQFTARDRRGVPAGKIRETLVSRRGDHGRRTVDAPRRNYVSSRDLHLRARRVSSFHKTVDVFKCDIFSAQFIFYSKKSSHFKFPPKSVSRQLNERAFFFFMRKHLSVNVCLNAQKGANLAFTCFLHHRQTRRIFFRARRGLVYRASPGRFIKTSPRASHPKCLVIYYSAAAARARINAAPCIEYLCAGRRHKSRHDSVSTLRVPRAFRIPRLVMRT